MKSSCTTDPVWLNGWKHHLGFVCSEIAKLERADQESFDQFFKGLMIMGSSVSDLYTGLLAPDEIALEISKQLIDMGLYNATPFFRWIDQAEKHNRELSISDGSKWTLLKGKPADFYLHIHPSRHSLYTARIKTTILKSAVALVAYVYAKQENDITALALNRVRKDCLGLPPIKEDHMKHILELAVDLQDRCEKTYRLR